MVSALFKAAEIGDLEKVREVLKECTSVDIEIKDHTGTTPLISAVKNGHVEVVQELLAAGADPTNPSSQGPPSSYTTAPVILTLLSGATPQLLQQQQQQPFYPPYDMYPPPPMDMNGGFQGYYPQQMYMPPYGMPFMSQQGMMPPPPQASQQEQGADGQQQPGAEGSDGAALPQGEGAGTIPPPDVSKMIPCKFYPDCRYGAQCAFQHPNPVSFIPSPPPQMFPQFDNRGPQFAPPFYHMGPPPFPYQQGPPMRPIHAMSPPPPSQGPYAYQHQSQHHLSDYNENAFIVVPPPFQTAPNFSPSAPSFSPSVHASTFAPPIEPSPSHSSPSSAPADTPAAAPSASSTALDDPAIVSSSPALTSPSDDPAPTTVEETPAPQQQQAAPVSNLPFAPREFANGHVGGFGMRGGFRGGFKKFTGPPHAFKSGAKWLGGNAPPCMYFQKGVCRNGEMCRFPHIGSDGQDCRLPGVIDGTIPAAPISLAAKANAHRAFPLTLESQLPAELRTSSSNASSEVSAVTNRLGAISLESSVASLDRSPPAAGRPFTASASTPAFVPAQRTPPFVVQPHNRFGSQSQPQLPPQAIRSQPGTRSASPNVPVVPYGQRAVSAAPVQRLPMRQRVPSSDDFPALGSSTGSLRESGVLVQPQLAGMRSAAQVLSGPAPVKTAPKKEEKEIKATEDSSSSSDNAHTDVSEDDAVVISSSKSAPSAPNGAPSPTPTPTPMPVKKGPVVSFASAAGAMVGAKA